MNNINNINGNISEKVVQSMLREIQIENGQDETSLEIELLLNNLL